MQTKTLRVDGMSCQHCIKRITNALKEVNGVLSVTVSLEDKTVTLELDSPVSDDILKEIIEDAGYDLV